MDVRADDEPHVSERVCLCGRLVGVENTEGEACLSMKILIFGSIQVEMQVDSWIYKS